MKAGKLAPEYFELLERCPLVPIRTDRALSRALNVVKELSVDEANGFLSQTGSDYLEVLAGLVAQYERGHVKGVTEPMSPVDAVRYLMEENGLTLGGLADEIGGHKSNLSMFLTGQRGLSKKLAMKLAERFAVSTEVFFRGVGE